MGDRTANPKGEGGSAPTWILAERADDVLEQLAATATPGRAPPLYWRNETSGRMKAIVGRFLAHGRLNGTDLPVLRWYVFQWVSWMRVPQELLNRIRGARSQEELRAILAELLDWGVDPL